MWLTTGYRTAALSSNPAVHGLVDTAPRLLGLPLLVNLPAFGIVLLITWLLLRGVRESTTANNVMVVVKLLALGLFIAVGLGNINPANYHPFAPNGFTGIHQGAAIVFFAYIGFDAISTAAEETINPQRNLPIGILGGLAVCTLIYVIVGAVLTGMVPYQQLAVADPLARALEIAGFTTVGWVVALGAAVSMAAVLLVFQYGQPRIFFAMARDGLLPQWAAKVNRRTRVPYVTTLLTGGLVAVAAAVGDAAETYDLTNIGTLFAFALVCVGVLVLRIVGARTAAAVPRAARVADCAARRRGVRVHHGRPAAPGVGALRPVAGRRVSWCISPTAIATRACAMSSPEPRPVAAGAAAGRPVVRAYPARRRDRDRPRSAERAGARRHPRVAAARQRAVRGGPASRLPISPAATGRT